MSATRPAIEFSIGIMPSSARPSCSAAKASSNVAQGSGSMVGIILDAGDVRIRARLALIGDRLAVCAHRSFLRRQHFAGALQILGRVDAERRDVDQRDVDPHARLERAQLLQLLALLERRGRQRDEARERRAAIGVEADMMQQRALAPRRRRAGKIERAQPAGADRRPDRLDDVGIVALLGARDRRRERRDVDLRSASGPTAARTASRSIVGRSPCTLTTTSWRRSGSKRASASAMRSEPEA